LRLAVSDLDAPLIDCRGAIRAALAVALADRGLPAGSYGHGAARAGGGMSGWAMT
jgi:hypothetical protein